jgi:hypothetical protein
MAVLVCVRCFSKVTRTSSRQLRCGDCAKEIRRERDKQRRLDNPEKYRANSHRWYANNKARSLENNRRWRAARAGARRALEIKQQLSEERSSSSFEFAAA